MCKPQWQLGESEAVGTIFIRMKLQRSLVKKIDIVTLVTVINAAAKLKEMDKY